MGTMYEMMPKMREDSMTSCSSGERAETLTFCHGMLEEKKEKFGVSLK